MLMARHFWESWDTHGVYLFASMLFTHLLAWMFWCDFLFEGRGDLLVEVGELELGRKRGNVNNGLREPGPYPFENLVSYLTIYVTYLNFEIPSHFVGNKNL